MKIENKLTFNNIRKNISFKKVLHKSQFYVNIIYIIWNSMKKQSKYMN